MPKISTHKCRFKKETGSLPRLLLVCQTEAMPSETAFRSKTMISIFDIVD
ncbi:hypothetical protein NEIPOLOT_02605 [Neisseria polysaccharea ATCC 43768]|nr:hypothetical protein NEIPOLOT_02605 [Neisseria polysaccharea ATCC 43768]